MKKDVIIKGILRKEKLLDKEKYDLMEKRLKNESEEYLLNRYDDISRTVAL